MRHSPMGMTSGLFRYSRSRANADFFLTKLFESLCDKKVAVLRAPLVSKLSLEARVPGRYRQDVGKAVRTSV